ncbi:MAG: alpha/beta fold hydrolase [Bacteroidota bacterium]
MRQKIKYTLAFFLLLALLFGVAVHFVAPYAIVQPPRIQEDLQPADLQLSSEELALRTEEGFPLAAYWIKSARDSVRGLIILVHGIGGCKEHFLPLAKELAQQGIETVVFDGRAHGRSGGEFCTFGYQEKKDISRIVDYIRQQQPDLKIGIWGNSLGGAIAIQALEIEQRIEFGIIESTFTRLDQIVYDYQQRLSMGLGKRWLSDHALRRAGALAQFDPQKVRPIESVRHLHQALFLAHGDRDENISVTYGQALFDQLASPQKELFIVPGGGHFDLFLQGGAPYKNALFHFINQQLP